MIASVARGRGVTAARVRKDFGGGRMMDATAAVRAGLADRIDTLDGVIAKASAAGPAGRAAGNALIAADQKLFRDLELRQLLPLEERVAFRAQARADAAECQADIDRLDLALLCRR